MLKSDGIFLQLNRIKFELLFVRNNSNCFYGKKERQNLIILTGNFDSTARFLLTDLHEKNRIWGQYHVNAVQYHLHPRSLLVFRVLSLIVILLWRAYGIDNKLCSVLLRSSYNPRSWTGVSTFRKNTKASTSQKGLVFGDWPGWSLKYDIVTHYYAVQVQRM